MASRLLHRLKRSLFKDDHDGATPTSGTTPIPEATPTSGATATPGAEQCTGGWEAELEEEECVSERLGGKLCFNSGQDEGADEEDEGSGQDSDSDVLGDWMEEGLRSTGVLA